MTSSNTLKLSTDEQKVIESSVASIRKVLRQHNMDVKSIVGSVTAADMANTQSAVEVRFAEGAAMHSVMNMIAMD
jgi:hypothetical protein